MNFGCPFGSVPLTKSTGMQPNASAAHSLSCREDSWKVYDEGGILGVAKPTSASAQSSDPFPVGSTIHMQLQGKPPPHLIPAPLPRVCWSSSQVANRGARESQTEATSNFTVRVCCVDPTQALWNQETVQSCPVSNIM